MYIIHYFRNWVHIITEWPSGLKSQTEKNISFEDTSSKPVFPHPVFQNLYNFWSFILACICSFSTLLVLITQGSREKWNVPDGNPSSSRWCEWRRTPRRRWSESARTRSVPANSDKRIKHKQFDSIRILASGCFTSSSSSSFPVVNYCVACGGRPLLLLLLPQSRPISVGYV